MKMKSRGLSRKFAYVVYGGGVIGVVGQVVKVVMLLSCILAFLLNYSVFLNTTLNSALTQTICGNLKDLFTVGVGWLLFGGLPFDLLNVIGQSLGFLGSCLYAYCKLTGKHNNDAPVLHPMEASHSKRWTLLPFTATKFKLGVK